jgi:hypothetical protein
MTTVAAKPAAPAAEEQRHRLTALEGVAHCPWMRCCRWPTVPRRLRFRLANCEPDHDG